MTFSARQIWEAGRKALGLPVTLEDAKTEGVALPDVPSEQSGEVAPAVFATETQTVFGPGVYRIHFKNGLSGEYHGTALAQQFPFDPREVESIEEA
jgi:hypothetical protein